ncbi:cold shock domain-containing protein, partial [Patescibacteria group bacterium]|nr:cold shock domain-containing protein [Patescibacteria group bacterium]
MPTGTLKVLLTREHPARSGGSGFGFIAQDDGPDVFVLFSELEALFDRYGGEKGLWAELQKGPIRVAFKTTRTKRGLQATDVGPQTIERFRVAASEQYFRGGVPAPRLVLEHLYNGQVLADRAILFESEQDLSRLTEDPWLECSPELVLRIKERLGEYLARPVFTVFSSVRVPERLQFGEYSSGCPLTDDELRGLRVVATRHDQPGKRARISVSVAPEGYSDAEAVELVHVSTWRSGAESDHSVLQQLVGLGVVCKKACVACGFVLYTQGEVQRVHRGEGLGSFCDDGLNGDLHQHRWEQMAEAASKRMGYGEP